MQVYDGWEILLDDKDPTHARTLGKGGQGEVFLARSPEQARRRSHAEKLARDYLIQVPSGRSNMIELAKNLYELAGPDSTEDLGALKKFIIPSDNKEEEAKAIGRLETEVKALQSLKGEPGVLNLMYANVPGRFIVTEFHPRGTLNKHLGVYKGNVLAALEAFKPLVDAVCRIHEQGAIHRDIKTENIFITESGSLALGDFGIVFFHGSEKDDGRLTTTYERVGSHYWMAPWAYDNVRLELSKINTSLDIFPLCKVLWSMIAGQNGFPFWEYDREINDLQKRFPYDPLMSLVNERILSTRIVREENLCNKSAQALRIQVEGLINQIKDLYGFKPDHAKVWPCKICGRGKYKSSEQKFQIKGTREGGQALLEKQSFFASICDHCGHAELFTE